MASRREYEMMFVLGAQMKNNFNSSFNEVLKKIQSLQKDIEKLNSILKDVSGYDKLSQKIEENKSKMAAYEKQLGALKEKIKAEGDASGELATKKLKLEHRIENLKNKISEEEQALERMRKRMQEAGVNTEELDKESERLKAELEKLKNEQAEVANGSIEMSATFSDSVNAMSEVLAATAILSKIKQIYEAYEDCIEVATEFGWEMANVKALSEATEEEFGQLTEKAKELGATTKYTATESAQAMGYMAMAGWKTEDMIEGMDGVINLAAAANTDLAETSSIVTDSLNAFGLKASDTAHFADVLAAGATNSNTTVSLMGETFKYSAASAGALGYKIEDIAIAMGLMADMGIKGTMAGTSLRMTLSKLLQGAEFTSKAFAEAGEETGTYMFTSLNADGTLKTFRETLDELRNTFSQMSAEEKIQNAQNIAGVRSYNGLLAMLNASEDEYNKLSEAIDNCDGAAERMADTKMDSVKGDWYLMTSAFDALKTSIGEVNDSEIRDLYTILKEIFDELNQFVIDNPTTVKAILAFVGTFGALTAAITAAAGAIKLFNVVMKAMGVASAASLGTVGLAVTGISALVAGLVYLGELTKPNEELLALTQEADSLASAMDDANAALSETNETIYANGAVATLYVDHLERLKQQGLENDDVYREYETTLGLLLDIMPELNAYIDTSTDRWNADEEAIRNEIKAIEDRAKAEAKQQFLSEVQEKYNSILVEQYKNEAKLAAAKAKEESANENLNKALSKQDEIYAGMRAEEEDYLEKYGNVIDVTWKYQDVIDSLNDEIALYGNEQAAAEREVETYTTAIEKDKIAVAEASEELMYANQVISENASEASDAASETSNYADATESIIALTEAHTEALDALKEAYEEAYETAYKNIEKVFKLTEEVEKEEDPLTISEFNKAIESQLEYWSQYEKDLDKLGAKTGNISGLKEVLQYLADGSEDSVSAVHAMANASDEDLGEMVNNYIDLKEKQDELATNIAELQTEYDRKIQELTGNFTAAVDSMDLSDDALLAGKSTIDGYIEGLESGEHTIGEYFSRLARAAKIAFGLSYANTLSGEGYEGYNIPATGYASGTSSASRGLHLVGENGPELVYMRGGETVLNAADTERSLSVAGTPVQINFNITGGDSAGVRQVLNDYADDFVDKVRSALRDISNENARRAYA